MPRFRDQAIVLREIDWSETSQILVLLTEQRGKVRGLAKGSKRLSPSSVQRFSGGLELLTRGEVLATTKPTAELAAITEWDLQDDYPNLRRDYPAWRAGMYAADLVNALLAELDPHPGSFAALQTLLDHIGPLHDSATRGHRPSSGDPRVAAALLRFQWTLLEDVGYRPELVADVNTGEALPARKTYSFDPAGGGLTLTGGLTDWRVRSQTVELLRVLAAAQPIDAFDAASLTRANRLLCVYARHLLEVQLPTMSFLLDQA